MAIVSYLNVVCRLVAVTLTVCIVGNCLHQKGSTEAAWKSRISKESEYGAWQFKA